MEQTDIITKIDSWGVTQPERIAYQDEEKTYTYGQLKSCSDNLANELAAKFPNHEPIIVFGELEFEMLICFLGAVKSGHSYIPIESTTPEQRIQMIIETANPAAVISVVDWTQSDNLPVITKTELNKIFTQAQPIAKQPAAGNNTFYIIFTSGTTGVPKGVQISCRNLESFVNWELQAFPIQSGMRFLSQAPYSFDLSVMSIYPALVSGGILIPINKETLQNFKELFQLLPTLQLNVWVSTPSFIEICLMESAFDALHMPDLKIFLFCGEELPHKTAAKLLERFPQAAIYNTYGPTEATVAISQIRITAEVLENYPRLPIGYVKEDTEVFIVKEGQLLPSESSGEIVISGPSVSKGYLNNPTKTQEAFIELNGQPAYKTGDAGSIGEDGLLFYEGRMDFQIKWHGFRIELEDIDHHLEESFLVKQATVVPKFFHDKVQQLIAYVVPEENEFQKEYELTKAIKKNLKEQVMDYMVPQKFVYVDQLPRTPNGKIDRKGLMGEVNQA